MIDSVWELAGATGCACPGGLPMRATRRAGASPFDALHREFARDN
ncbi:hypothetical protein [Pseudomonas sp. YJ42]